ncbi:MAG: DNA-3-methyladenine glycosylase I [Pseudomonadota bacterium]|nr:DNA-3-methyladenine glycosylase I [Pseudomonadota bacterium]
MSHRYCVIAPEHPVHGPYHNTEYGFPQRDERILFERLALEIMQAGLSWEIVLKKRKALRKAFDRFDVRTVAAYTAADERRLMGDAGIIRNRLKIKAIIRNAGCLLEMRKSHKGFANWLAQHHPLDKAQWVRLFKKRFSFTGGEITGEFLMSIGYLPGAHAKDCPAFRIVEKLAPPWTGADADRRNVPPSSPTAGHR